MAVPWKRCAAVAPLLAILLQVAPASAAASLRSRASREDPHDYEAIAPFGDEETARKLQQEASEAMGTGNCREEPWLDFCQEDCRRDPRHEFCDEVRRYNERSSKH
eukprot:TRINITY_DN5962_c0_g1_i4.p3 TRINITY_DN5962_c0_g1~~TRINITY_DN5962_c0_g1_i4.p3  ORF type:complete len:106 (-),score=27.74 TRINITY_DN5962_c0_g1_i4:139-456(-)